MTAPSHRWPYPTIAADGSARTDVDGDNQVCECGNDSHSYDWYAADGEGRLCAEAMGSPDPSEHAVCPQCGRVYLNEDLFSGRAAPAVVRYAVDDHEFRSALRVYEREAYGAPGSL